MEIQSTRFGRQEIDPARVLTMHNGLLGYPEHHCFVLLPGGDDIRWLQSSEDPNLAFAVIDPQRYFADYDVPVREELRDALRIDGMPRLQVWAICNLVGEWLTANLLGPIVVNTANGLAEQVIQTEKKWTIRQPLRRLDQSVPLARSA